MSPVVAVESRTPDADEGLACLQERLEQSAVVTSRLCHDFGNYLTGIMGFSELALTYAEPDSNQQRYLNEVLTSARQGAEWILRLHLFCRRGGLNAWPSDLASVVAEAGSRSAEGSEFRWAREVAADLPLLAMDAISLQAVLGELADNAREATQGKGVLSITARVVTLSETDCRGILGSTQAGLHVEIAVSDDGPGFAADVRPRLFRETFFSTKPRHRGLGLLVVYGTLHRFRGGVKLEPSSANAGAGLRLYVPVAFVAGPGLTTNAGAPQILLIYANAPLFQSIRKILEARGCTVEMAAAVDGKAPVGRAFSLVMIETALSQLSGFDLARRILDHDPRANFLFVHTQGSCHGLADEELLKQFGLLRWPLELQTLLQAVQSTLTRTMAKN